MIWAAPYRHAMSPTLDALVSCYPILTSLSSHISALDLYHLSLTCSYIYSSIHCNEATFLLLGRRCICIGDNLPDRPLRHRPNLAKELATRATCDPYDASPCDKCGINVCWFCKSSYEKRFHSVAPGGLVYEIENNICFCSQCDTELECKFGNEGGVCTCDEYDNERWICLKCTKMTIGLNLTIGTTWEVTMWAKCGL